MLTVPASRVCKILPYPIIYKDGWIYGDEKGKIKASEYKCLLRNVLNYSREAKDVYEWICEMTGDKYDKHFKMYIIDYLDLFIAAKK